MPYREPSAHVFGLTTVMLVAIEKATIAPVTKCTPKAIKIVCAAMKERVKVKDNFHALKTYLCKRTWAS